MGVTLTFELNYGDSIFEDILQVLREIELRDGAEIKDYWICGILEGGGYVRRLEPFDSPDMRRKHVMTPKGSDLYSAMFSSLTTDLIEQKKKEIFMLEQGERDALFHKLFDQKNR